MEKLIEDLETERARLTRHSSSLLSAAAGAGALGGVGGPASSSENSPYSDTNTRSPQRYSRYPPQNSKKVETLLYREALSQKSC